MLPIFDRSWGNRGTVFWRWLDQLPHGILIVEVNYLCYVGLVQAEAIFEWLCGSPRLKSIESHSPKFTGVPYQGYTHQPNVPCVSKHVTYMASRFFKLSIEPVVKTKSRLNKIAVWSLFIWDIIVLLKCSYKAGSILCYYMTLLLFLIFWIFKDIYTIITGIVLNNR